MRIHHLQSATIGAGLQSVHVCRQNMHHRVHFALRGGGEGEMGGRGRRAQANSGEAAQDDKKGINKASLSRAGLLVLLLGLYTHNQLTRSSLFFSVNFAAAGGGGASSTEAAAKEFMNVALSFGPSQYALLASYGFTLLYALVSLPAGRAADTHDCAKTLAAASLVWSLALALQGSPWSSFPLVWICRVVQGIAMAFTGPQAISLLADAFPGPKLAFATSFYSTGVYIGGSLASLSMIANARFGWRATFLSISAVGVVMSLGLAAITKGMGLGKREEVSKNEVSDQGRKPGRGGGGGGGGGGGAVSSSSGNSSSKGAISLGLDAAWEVVRCRGIAWLLAATATRFCAGYGIGIWLAPFFRAKFPTMQAQYAVVSALTIGGGGCLSTLAGGVITEKLAAKDRRAVLRVPIIGCLLAIPSFLMAISASTFTTSMLFYVASFLTAECWIGAVMFILSQEVPSRVRGTATSMLSMLTIFGNLAPLLIGFVVQRGVMLQYALAAVVGSAYALSGLLFYKASRVLWGDEGNAKAA